MKRESEGSSGADSKAAAQRFWEFFRESKGDPRIAPDSVLWSLSWRYCMLPVKAWDKPMIEHWRHRRALALNFIGYASKLVRLIDDLVFEEIAIQAHYQVLGTGRTPASRIGATSLEGTAVALKMLKNDLIEAQRFCAAIARKRKPRIEDDRNFFLVVMDAYLRNRSPKMPHTAACAEIALYVSAHQYSVNQNAKHVDQEDIQTRIERFRERNPEVAAQIYSDPSPLVERYSKDLKKGDS